MPSTYYVAWWNLENLFDEENSPRRTEKLQRTIGGDLVGWTPARRDRKVAQLSSVVAQMNSGAGPDLLGVCEVENRFVRRPARRLRQGTAARPQLRRSSTPTPTTPAGSTSPSSTTPASSRAAGGGVLPRRDAPQRDPRARPGQLPDAEEPHLDRVRESLAVTQRRPGSSRPATATSPARRSATSTNAPSRSTARHTRARDGRLQRRAVRHLARHPRAQHAPTAAGRGCRQPDVLEPDLAGDRRPARRQLLLQQRAEPARPVPRQQEHGPPGLTDQGEARYPPDPPLPRHLHRQIQAAEAVRRHGQTRR